MSILVISTDIGVSVEVNGKEVLSLPKQEAFNLAMDILASIGEEDRGLLDELTSSGLKAEMLEDGTWKRTK